MALFFIYLTIPTSIQPYSITEIIARISVQTSTATTVKCIFWGFGAQNFALNLKVPFEILHKIVNPYAEKYAFHEVLKMSRIVISQSYNILKVDYLIICIICDTDSVNKLTLKMYTLHKYK